MSTPSKTSCKEAVEALAALTISDMTYEERLYRSAIDARRGAERAHRIAGNTVSTWACAKFRGGLRGTKCGVSSEGPGYMLRHGRRKKGETPVLAAVRIKIWLPHGVWDRAEMTLSAQCSTFEALEAWIARTVTGLRAYVAATVPLKEIK